VNEPIEKVQFVCGTQKNWALKYKFHLPNVCILILHFVILCTATTSGLFNKRMLCSNVADDIVFTGLTHIVLFLKHKLNVQYSLYICIVITNNSTPIHYYKER